MSLEQYRNYCGLKKIARCGFPWEKTTKRPVASVYTYCETALDRIGYRSRPKPLRVAWLVIKKSRSAYPIGHGKARPGRDGKWCKGSAFGGAFRWLSAVMLVLCVNPGVTQVDGSIAYGPYNAVFLDSGTGLTKPLVAGDVLLDPGAQWSIYSWVRVSKPMVATR